MGYDFASGFFKCPRCGNDTFVCYPQTISLDKSRPQIWEYTCEKCGCVTALKLKDWSEEE